QVIRQFEPFFAASADYTPIDQAGIGVSSRMHYDAPGRLIRTDTPLQTFRTTAYGWQLNAPPSAWSVAAYDENDTLLQSQYYADLISAPTPDPWEKQVVEAAALCTDSPSRSCFDPMGRVVRTVAQDAAVVTAAQLLPLGYDQSQAEQLLAALVTAGYLDAEDRFTPSFTPQSAGWLVHLPAPFDADAAAITALLEGLLRTGTPLVTDLVLDPSGNPARVSDPRLGASGLANFVSLWSLVGSDVHTVSADAGPHWRLRNAAGKVVWQRDGAGTVTVTGYDPLQRPASQLIDAGGAHPTGTIGIYGDSVDPAGQPYFAESQRWNLRGQLVVALDASGLALGPFHSIQGKPYAQSRTLRADTATVPNWATISQQTLAELCTAIAALAEPADLAGLLLPTELQALLDPACYVERTGYDALGQATQLTDADGNVIDYSLDLRGLVQAVRFEPADTALAAVEFGPIDYDAHDRPISLTVPGVLRTSLEYHPLTFLLTGLRTVSLALPAPPDPIRQALTYYHDPVGNIGITLDAAAVPIPAGPAPAGRYGYSPLYQLLTATGREASGADTVAYQQDYRYDDGGNLITVTHSGATEWQRSFAIAADSNRLTGDVSYNVNGGLLSFPGVTAVSWTGANQIGSLTTAPAADGSYAREYSAYAAGGTRTRRLTERYTAADQPDGSEQVSYPGLLEIVRQTAADASVREWHTTRLSAGPLQLGRWIGWFDGQPDGTPKAGMRFPLLDNLGSMVGELDEHGEPLTHQEYQPFGADALSWSAAPLDEQLQRERYS
ncbi:MAG TPA: hypothetical protein VH298_12630, partial [Jatrophihabitans sp.]|nr:hypothetical protein [Jatrophihabitans sp.]